MYVKIMYRRYTFFFDLFLIIFRQRERDHDGIFQREHECRWTRNKASFLARQTHTSRRFLRDPLGQIFGSILLINSSLLLKQRD